MKLNKMLRYVQSGISIVLVLTLLGGCSWQQKASGKAELEKMEAEKVNSVSFDIIGGKNVMPIGGYYGPYVSTYNEDSQTAPDYFTDEIWQAIADSGINWVSYSQLNYKDYPELVRKSLDYGEKYGLAVNVYDSTVLDMAQESEISVEELTTRLSEYMNHPAFGGMYIIDEPCTSYFHPAGEGMESRYLDYYKKLAPTLNQKLGMLSYTNAFPSGIERNEYEYYEKYIREFYDTLQPKYLMFDRYPFDASQKGYINYYFHDLAVVRKVAEEKEIPFMTFIQAGSQWNDAREYFDSVTPYYPNEAQFDWNINTALAFGAKGINLFTLIQPDYFAYAESKRFDFQRNGLIGAWGNKNQWYYYLQNISKQIRAIDEVLMNSTSKGVLAYGKTAEKELSLAKENGAVIEGKTFRELKALEGEALVGCFNYQGKTALYVVNYSMEAGQKLNLTFQDTYDFTKIQNAETEKLYGDGLTLDMAPGEGVLLVFE